MTSSKNRNTVFSPLSYESAFSHIHNLEEDIEANRLTPATKRQIPAAVCTIIEQFCRTKKKFAYVDGEPMPRELGLKVPLVMDMLDWSDSWCTDNTRRHEKILCKHVEDITGDGIFKIDVEDLSVLIDDACDIRPPWIIESLAASVLGFQSVGAVNSLDITGHILGRYGEVGVEEYEALFEMRHTQIHTLENVKFSPRACVALAKDLFGVILGHDGFAFYSGCAFSEAGRHASAVRSLGLVGDPKSVSGNSSGWKYLLHLGRSLAHVGDERAAPVLHMAVDSLLEHTKAIPKHKKKEGAWLRMEAARAMCDLADGFRATNEDRHETYVDEVLEICADLADAYWLAGARLSKLGFSSRSSLKCFKKAYELVKNVDTANAVGTTCFKMGMYKDAVEWFKKAGGSNSPDVCVRRALEQAENHLAAQSGETQPP